MKILRIILPTIFLVLLAIVLTTNSVGAALPTIRVAASAQDSNKSGATYNNAHASVWCGQNGGNVLGSAMIFTGVAIPVGSVIHTATITFTASATRNSQTLNTRLYAEDTDTPSDYGAAEDFTSRTYTTAYTTWSGSVSWTSGTTYASPSLVTVVQELVDSYDYSAGKSMAFFWKDNGTGNNIYQQAYSYDGDSAKAPLLTIYFSPPDAYWVGNGGNWSPVTPSTGHWALTSGGSSNDGIVTGVNTNVHFNGLSGTGNIVNGGSTPHLFHDMNWTGANGLNLAFGNAEYLECYGSLTLSPDCSYSVANDCGIRFYPTGAETITSNGAYFNSCMIMESTSGTVTLADDLNLNQLIVDGNFDTGNQDVTIPVNAWNHRDSVTVDLPVGKTFNMGSSVFTINGEYWDDNTAASEGTVNPGTSIINMNKTGTFTIFTGVSTSAATYNTININAAGSYYLGGFSCVNLYVIPQNSADQVVSLNGDLTVTGSCNIAGYSSSYRVLIKSDTLHTQRTLTLANTSLLTNVLFRDIIGVGTGNWDFSARTDVGDCYGNTNITFPTGVTCTASAFGGNKNFTAGTWSPRIPLPQDTALFNATSVTTPGPIITFDISNLPAINTLAVQNNPQFDGTTAYFYGSIQLGTCLWNVTTSTYMLGQTSPQSLSGDLSFGTCDFYVDVQGGSIDQSGALTIAAANTTYLQSGIWVTNGYTISTGIFDSNTNTYTRAFWMGSGDSTYSSLVYLTSTAAAIKWKVNATNLNIDCIHSTIINVNTSTNTQQFTGAGKTYYNLAITGSGSYTFQFNDANTFNNVTVIRSNANYQNAGATGAAAKTISGNYAQTVNHFYSPLYGTTITTITNVDLIKTIGLVALDYMSISGSDASGGATFLAGSHSTDVQTANLGDNTDFETGTPPTSWTVWGAGAGWSRSNTQVKNGSYSGQLIRNGADSGIWQSISSPTTYNSKLFTFNMWIYASVANVGRIGITDENGSVYSSYHTSTAGWEYFTVSKQLDASVSYINIQCEVNNSNATVYFDYGTATASTNKGWSFTDFVSPVISAYAATGTTHTGATLQGSVDSMGTFGGEGINIDFEYGLSAAYGSYIPTTAVNVTSTGIKTAGLTGLTFNTTYHFRMRAEYNGGYYLYTDDGTFTTLGAPIVTTQNPTSITSTSATLNGFLSDLGDYLTVACSMQYKLSTDGAWTSTTSEVGMTATGSYSFTVSPLQTGKTYNVRAACRYNGTVYVYGSTLSFTAIPTNASFNTMTGTIQTATMPTSWFGLGVNASKLPFYGQTGAGGWGFSRVAEETGITVQTLYLMMMLATVSAVMFGVALFTGSILLTLSAGAVTLGMAVSSTVASGWMIFIFLLMGAGIWYLSRQN